MSPVAGLLAKLAAQIAALSGDLGRRATLDLPGLTERMGDLPLETPGLWSPNRACRLVQAADGWIAVNLAREDDVALVPAWLGCEPTDEPWPAILAAARRRAWRDLVDGARLLGLPAAGVGEVAAETMTSPLLPAGRAAAHGGRDLRVVDLSTLWAGPLCGAVLAATGASVTKVESRRRPDPSRVSTPDFFRRLNGAKADLVLDFAEASDRARLREMIVSAEVVITSARPRAFEQLGLAPADLFAERPDLTWVAISGYGWTGEAAERVAFGDDAAAAGGLVRWTPSGEPNFLGDALGDPLTGLAAAAGALRALAQGGGLIVDAALARTAAGAAAELGLRAAA
ncbi:CoA transferase [Phenylobacterium sp. LjRoot225]|uniref:CoA transferase n=1 Tax=Phenylobacterium sp. LjRoot225 TaxID=3342285 RepID=UPI003ECEDEAB